MHGYHEFVIGGVLVAPFVLFAFGAAVVLALLRPLLRRAGLEHAFSNPPMAMLCLYVVILALMVTLL